VHSGTVGLQKNPNLGGFFAVKLKPENLALAFLLKKIDILNYA